MITDFKKRSACGFATVFELHSKVHFSTAIGLIFSLEFRVGGEMEL
jgi:hypothetical protein